MFAPFDETLARQVCQQMMADLEKEKCAWTGMFGALVCSDSEGKRTVLRAFSGSFNGKWNHEGWAPPLFDEEKYNSAISINDKKIHELSEVPPNESAEEKSARDKERLELCNQTLERIYSLYRFCCFDGKWRTFKDISKGKLLPTGTGDCAEPKLLSEAFEKNLLPLSMAEFYWGKANTRLLPKSFYPPCDEKCALILPAILGLEIIYRDKNILVVNKPSGLLSVPGRGPEKQDCVVTRAQRLFPQMIRQPSVHRLDMDTSGLMLLAFDQESHRALNAQFENRQVQKKYVAVLDGLVKEQEGRVEIKHRVDIENRPLQILDDQYGKLAVTEWERLRVWNRDGKTVTSILFTPHTGRTHQLRVASAYALGAPIVGDNLYGNEAAANSDEEKQIKKSRLLLHASDLCFEHPITGKKMEFHSQPEFSF
ncbi:MAG: RluA family pseudouridine synthase [Treponema sp.]|nr:RluA family pseudouridine synthase [Treponema sp.]